jgi:P27 family predicted phage terminase small subunit
MMPSTPEVDQSPREPLEPAPDHLSSNARQWWNEVVAHHILNPHELMLLQAACESWDRRGEAVREIAREGLTYTDDKGNTKPNPATVIEASATASFAKLIKQLGLDAGKLRR